MLKEKEHNFISAVVYVHNNEKNIAAYIKVLYQYFETNFHKFEIIFADDASEDASVKQIKKTIKENAYKNVSLVTMGIFQGREAAMEAGLSLSIGDYVYEMDWIDVLDPEHYDEILMQAYKTALSGYDIVSVASEKAKDSATSFFYKVFNRYSVSRQYLTYERFRLVTRRAINRVNTLNQDIIYRKALYAACGLRLKTIDNNPIKKPKKTEKIIRSNTNSLAVNTLLVYTSFFQKIVLVFNIITISACILFWIATLLSLVLKQHVSAFLLTGTLFTTGIAIVNGGLYIILQYCILLSNLIVKNKKYTIESVNKLENSEDEQ